MFDFLFFIKTLVMTFVLVAFLQVRVGQDTLEWHATHFIQTSAITEPLRQVAIGGSKLVRDGFNFVSREINARVQGSWKWGEQRAGERFKWTFERSEKAKPAHHEAEKE